MENAELLLVNYSELVREADSLNNQSFIKEIKAELTNLINYEVSFEEIINSKNKKIRITGLKQTERFLERTMKNISRYSAVYDVVKKKPFDALFKLIHKMKLLINVLIS